MFLAITLVGEFNKDPNSPIDTVFNSAWRFNGINTDMVCRGHFLSFVWLSPSYYLCSLRPHWAWIPVCSRSSLRGHCRVIFMAWQGGWPFQWGGLSLGHKLITLNANLALISFNMIEFCYYIEQLCLELTQESPLLFFSSSNHLYRHAAELTMVYHTSTPFHQPVIHQVFNQSGCSAIACR